MYPLLLLSLLLLFIFRSPPFCAPPFCSCTTLFSDADLLKLRVSSTWSSPSSLLPLECLKIFVNDVSLVEFRYECSESNLTLTIGGFHVHCCGAYCGWFADYAVLTAGSWPPRGESDTFASRSSSFRVCVRTLSARSAQYEDRRAACCSRKRLSFLSDRRERPALARFSAESPESLTSASSFVVMEANHWSRPLSRPRILCSVKTWNRIRTFSLGRLSDLEKTKKRSENI